MSTRCHTPDTHASTATAAETLDTDGHLWPDDDDRIRATMDAAYRSPVGGATLTS